MLKYLNIGWIDLLDILTVTLLLFYLYRILRRSRTLYVFVGIVIFLLLWLSSQSLNFKMFGVIMQEFVSAGAVSLVVIFQDEIRKFFYNLGSNEKVKNFISSLHTEQKENDDKNKQKMVPVVMACISLARHKVGALIVLEKEQKLDEYIQSSDVIDANINQRLIENIFFKNSPLHDGAVIISNGRIKATSCILPVSHDYNIPKELGLRHRAALGISQESDALAIVVSEETGRISVAEGGRFHLRLTSEQLEQMIAR